MNKSSGFHVHREYGRWLITRNGMLFAQCQNKALAVKSARRLAARHDAVVVIHAMELAGSPWQGAIRTA